MISFFRNIRQSLIDSSSVRKYFIYAIGEISLVVIGILIALQVNNWNEAQKNRKGDLNFLMSLRKELVVDTSNFRGRFAYYRQVNDLIALGESIVRTQSDITIHQDSLLSKAIMQLAVLTPMEKNTNRSDLQISDGRLERISPEINELYMSYIEEVRAREKVVGKLGETLEQISLNYIYPVIRMNYIKENIMESSISFDYSGIYNNFIILNAFNKSYIYRKVYLNHLTDLIDRATSLIMRIDSVLNEEGRSMLE